MTYAEPAHIADELPALLAGELTREQTLAVAAHLRRCPECQEELVSMVVAAGTLRAAARAEQAPAAWPGFPPLASTPPSSAPVLENPENVPPETVPASPDWLRRIPRRGPARWSPRQRLVALAAAVVIAAGAVAAGLGLSASGPPVLNQAALRPLQAPAGASGAVTVTAASGARQVQVTTADLPDPGQGHFYEVWLLDPATLKMMPMGALAPSGQTTFAVAAGLMAGYSAVDISLQANNGNPAHSAVSVLRGTLRAN
ncbi:MAG: anti-sigma factor [Actinobacteria bacterium]|nr:anti-sigma factor [Actinomycetota bacterium]